MNLLKQYNVPWLGAFVDSLYTSLPILSIINFLSIITVLFATIEDRLFTWAPWLTFWWFVAILGGLTISTMGIIYIFVLPSVWTFRNKQMNKYESDVLAEIRALHEEIKAMKEDK